MEYTARRSNPAAWWAFWIGLGALILMPIPLVGWFLGGAPAALAAILAVIALFKSRHTGGKGIAPAVFALVFVFLVYGGISIGGGIWW